MLSLVVFGFFSTEILITVIINFKITTKFLFFRNCFTRQVFKACKYHLRQAQAITYNHQKVRPTKLFGTAKNKIPHKES